MERFYLDRHRNGYKSRILELRRHIDKYFSRGVTMLSLEYQLNFSYGVPWQLDSSCNSNIKPSAERPEAKYNHAK